eukprot:Cvel_26366.t1-p1 / transcript=Cvel_26366.t1 / gene=Cvel_26366 / organism=Chromera_velia_CCMP2878 / gene_product=hypothetical protein / transcript_product=hypothetical protein / location=Cvel_scaffold3124:1-2198(-) / protein_length=732 / sequence_SO=supercontig / SO=protein_coding / is_pseudo=false
MDSLSLRAKGVRDLSHFIDLICRYRPTKLDLSANQIQTLPDLSLLTSVESLDLSENPLSPDSITELISCLTSLPSLKHLHITPVESSWEEQLLVELPHLKSLNGILLQTHPNDQRGDLEVFKGSQTPLPTVPTDLQKSWRQHEPDAYRREIAVSEVNGHRVTVGPASDGGKGKERPGLRVTGSTSCSSGPHQDIDSTVRTSFGPYHPPSVSGEPTWASTSAWKRRYPDEANETDRDRAGRGEEEREKDTRPGSARVADDPYGTVRERDSISRVPAHANSFSLPIPQSAPAQLGGLSPASPADSHPLLAPPSEDPRNPNRTILGGGDGVLTDAEESVESLLKLLKKNLAEASQELSLLLASPLSLIPVISDDDAAIATRRQHTAASRVAEAQQAVKLLEQMLHRKHDSREKMSKCQAPLVKFLLPEVRTAPQKEAEKKRAEDLSRSVSAEEEERDKNGLSLSLSTVQAISSPPLPLRSSQKKENRLAVLHDDFHKPSNQRSPRVRHPCFSSPNGKSFFYPTSHAHTNANADRRHNPSNGPHSSSSLSHLLTFRESFQTSPEKKEDKGKREQTQRRSQPGSLSHTLSVSRTVTAPASPRLVRERERDGAPPPSSFGPSNAAARARAREEKQRQWEAVQTNRSSQQARRNGGSVLLSSSSRRGETERPSRPSSARAQGDSFLSSSAETSRKDLTVHERGEEKGGASRTRMSGSGGLKASSSGPDLRLGGGPGGGW